VPLLIVERIRRSELQMREKFLTLHQGKFTAYPENKQWDRQWLSTDVEGDNHAVRA
jgi:hypothetical protein